jgi:tRNA(Ile)-lysidine synthase
MQDITVKVRDYIDRHALIGKKDRILLSLSAGKDSMFLFHIMNLLAPDYGLEMGIYHLNHMTRGEESDRDERHLLKLSEINEIPIYVERFDFVANRISGMSFEEQARNMRYDLASKISVKHGYNKIATGHNRNDNIETILMRIFTGTGIYGLQGVPPRRNALIRPLLSLTADEIYGYLSDHNIEWLEDSTNTEIHHTRNFIRHEILPLLGSRFHAIDESIESLSIISSDAVHLIESFIEEKYPSLYEISGEDLYVDADKLISNRPLFCQAVSAGIRKFFNSHVNRKMLNEIYQKYLLNRSNISLYENGTIRIDKMHARERSWLKVSRSRIDFKTPSEWSYRIDPSELRSQNLYLEEIGLNITIEKTDYEYFEKYHKNNGYVFVLLENKIKTMYIRNRRKGDRIRTESGTKKIKDLFIEWKLDNTSKNRIPLLVIDSEIIACMPGLLFDIPNRVARDFLIDKKREGVLVVYKK